MNDNDIIAVFILFTGVFFLVVTMCQTTLQFFRIRKQKKALKAMICEKLKKYPKQFIICRYESDVEQNFCDAKFYGKAQTLKIRNGYNFLLAPAKMGEPNGVNL